MIIKTFLFSLSQYHMAWGKLEKIKFFLKTAGSSVIGLCHTLGQFPNKYASNIDSEFFHVYLIKAVESKACQKGFFNAPFQATVPKVLWNSHYGNGALVPFANGSL